MDLRQLDQFVTVYEEGSFSRAARRANCTQPALSVQIRNLEDELGVSLFTRSRRGVVPTIAGKRLYARSLSILSAVADTRIAVRELSGDVTGALTIGTVPSVSRSALPAALSRFTEVHPNVELTLDEAYGGTLTDRVAAGELDFAVVTSAVSHEGIEATLLAEHELVLVSGPGSGLTPFERIRLQDLSPLRMVLPTRRHAIRQLIDTHIARAELEVESTIESDGFEHDAGICTPFGLVDAHRGRFRDRCRGLRRPCHQPDRAASRTAGLLPDPSGSPTAEQRIRTFYTITTRGTGGDYPTLAHPFEQTIKVI